MRDAIDVVSLLYYGMKQSCMDVVSVWALSQYLNYTITDHAK